MVTDMAAYIPDGGSSEYAGLATDTEGEIFRLGFPLRGNESIHWNTPLADRHWTDNVLSVRHKPYFGPGQWPAGQRASIALLEAKAESHARVNWYILGTAKTPRKCWGSCFVSENWSGRWDSNPRPSPWQIGDRPSPYVSSYLQVVGSKAIASQHVHGFPCALLSKIHTCPKAKAG